MYHLDGNYLNFVVSCYGIYGRVDGGRALAREFACQVQTLNRPQRKGKKKKKNRIGNETILPSSILRSWS